MKRDYRDIIALPHHQSKMRPHMPLAARAAQFSPFAALSGYGDAVREAARVTVPKRVLSEEMRAELDRKLRLLCSRLPASPEVTLTYFVSDAVQEGGEYRTVRASIRKIDSQARVVILADQTRIPIDDIADIAGDDLAID